MEKLTPQEELQIENEVLKLKLETENESAKIYIAPGLDPEVENKWLNYIYNYEKVCKEAPKRSVYELIGMPDFKRAEELNDEELKTVLPDLLLKMHSNKVRFNYLQDYYTDRVLYTFITEELFNVIVDDIDMEGLIHMFTYEEFYPNHEYDMVQHTQTFMECVLSSHDWNNFNPVFIADEVFSNNGQLLSTHELIEIIQKAQQANYATTMTDLEIRKVEFDDKTGRVDFTLKYLRSTSTEPVTTLGHLSFINSYGFYEINEVYIPGILVA